MPFEIDDIRRVFAELESGFAVDSWQVGGLDVWPLIRIDLYLKMVTVEMAGDQAGTATSSTPQGSRVYPTRWAGILLGALKPVRYALKFGLQRVDVLMLSDGISFARIAGGNYEKFCDSTAAIYREGGASSLILNPVADATGSSFTPTVGIRGRLEAARFWSFLLSRLRRSPVHLERYDEFVRQVQARFGINPMSLADVLRSAQIVVAYADVFGAVIKTLVPKVAFQVSYYCAEGFAFNLACRNHGVRVFDLQHGVAGEMNAAYGFWNRVPVQGYALLPSDFWSWAKEDAQAIANWASRTQYHRVHCGGNLLLMLFQTAGMPLEQAEAHALADMVGVPSEGQINVLVTLQPNYLADAGWRDWLHGLMRQAGSGVRWWLRLHPMMMASLVDVEANLPQDLNGSVEVRISSALPLYALLPQADLHVTHSSSAVIESAAFGVVSIVLSRIGECYYQEFVEHGLAVVYCGGNWPTLLENCARGRKPPQDVVAGARASLDQARSMLRDLLAN